MIGRDVNYSVEEGSDRKEDEHRREFSTGIN